MSVGGKSKYKSTSAGRIYDTSECQVKFRKPRVLMDRNRSFDHDRELTFDHNRMIQARLQGVFFRDGFAVGFRNIGVSNIEVLSSKEDWPDVGPAKKPETLKKKKSKGYKKTWGPEQSFQQKWGQEAADPEDYLIRRKRIKPQLSHEKYSKIDEKPVEMVISTSPSKKKKKDSRSQVKFDTGKSISAPPSRVEVRSHSPVKRQVSSKDKKRAFAFNEYALALMEAGEYQKAMTYFNKALDLDPTEETYHINMDRCNQWLEYTNKGGR